MTAALRRVRGRLGGDGGSIIPLLAGLTAVTLALVLVVVDVTAVHLARVRMLDASDAAAADAADAITDPGYYTGPDPRLDDEGVAAAAERHLAARQRPGNVLDWRLAPGTGTTDGRDAVVVLTGEVQVPLVTGLLHALGGSVTVTVRSRAQGAGG